MRAFVGCRFLTHQLFKSKTNFYFMPIKGALENSTLQKWEQGRSPVGRVALIPTSVYITNKFYRSIETLYADVFCLCGLLLYANLRREEDIPTYGSLSLSARFYFMRILFNGVLENSILRKFDHFLLMLKGRL